MDSPAIGIDTEFMREKTYYPQLCLVQLNTGNQVYCVDPLAIADLTPLWQSLHAVELIVHSGRQDLEVIYLSYRQLPGRIFDTQVAAALLGEAPQIGYANLVKRLFGVELPKSHTRADWSQRPLRDSYLEYAAEDVKYLPDARQRLADELRAAGRLEWVLEDSAALLDPDLYVIAPEAAINRIRGARNLEGVSRSVAESLAAWREERAEASNRPRQWIMKDAVVLQLATQRPGTIAALSDIPGIAPATLRKQGEHLLQLISQAPKRNGYRPSPRPGEADKATLKYLVAAVARAATELGIAPEIIAPRKELSDAIAGGRSSRVFTGWRRQVVGKRLLERLES